jgi:hypothetical protein
MYAAVSTVTLIIALALIPAI